MAKQREKRLTPSNLTYSKDWKFVWWATAGCGSRSIERFLVQIGVSDLRDDEAPIQNGSSWSHRQGIPEGCEDFPVICNSRNPYTRLLSSWKDILVEQEENISDGAVKGHSKMSFESYLAKKERFYPPEELHYEKEWAQIGVKPSYKLRMEHLVEDIYNVEPFMKAEKDKIERYINAYIMNNVHANENRYDEYIKSPNGVLVQDCKPHYTQELADMVYEEFKLVFDFFGYEKDSWLL